MREIRLTKLMRVFSKEELKTFGRFVASNFLKQRKDTIALFDYLALLHPEYDTLTKEDVFSKLFKGEKYNEGKLRNLIFDLTKSAEHYIAFCTLQKDELELALTLSKGLQEKNLTGESIKINKEVAKNLHPTFSPGKDYISKFKRLAYLNYSYYAEKRDFQNVFKSMEDLFEASALQFIFEYMQMVSNMKIASIEYGNGIQDNFIQNIIEKVELEKLMEPLEKSNFEDNSYIGLHYHRFKTIVEPDDIRHFKKLKELLNDNLSDPMFDREEKWFFFTHLTNYCSQKMANKVVGFDKKGLEMYKEMVKNNSHTQSENHFMDIITLRNIVLLSSAQNDSKWLKCFLKDHSDCLHPDERENLIQYAMAHVHFMEKKYDKSLDTISYSKSDFSIFKADLKNLTLKIYYEMCDFEKAFAALESFRKFINSNNGITEIHKTPYKNYINLYSRLIKVKCGDKVEDLNSIKSKIVEDAPVASKMWLLKKLEELLSR